MYLRTHVLAYLAGPPGSNYIQSTPLNRVTLVPEHFDLIKRNLGVDPIKRSELILFLWFCSWPSDPINRWSDYAESTVYILVCEILDSTNSSVRCIIFEFEMSMLVYVVRHRLANQANVIISRICEFSTQNISKSKGAWNCGWLISPTFHAHAHSTFQYIKFM